MMLRVTKSRDRETLIGLAHVMTFVEADRGTRVRFLPGFFVLDDMLVDEPLDSFGGLPGMMPANLVSPHSDPKPALVNLANVVMAESCSEGTLLHTVGGRHAKLLIDATTAKIMDYSAGRDIAAEAAKAPA